MGLSRALGMILASSAMLMSGCASSDIMHLSREPAMPEKAVVEAAENGPLYKNVSIQDVQGAPEFLLFDGGGVITTRPTHKQILAIYNDDLDRANLLADSRASSDYMLYVKFEDLHGPDVWIGSDKRASARITFHLVRWKTGEIVKQQQVEVAYVPESPGVTARQVVAGGLGLAAGVGSGYGITKAYESVDGIRTWAAQALGAGKGTDNGIGTGELVLLVLNAGSLPRSQTTPLSSTVEIGPPDGTSRRIAAVHGLLDLALDEFLQELSADGSILYKQGVGCAVLNPQGYRSTYLRETPDSYGVDCPDSHFFASRLSRAYPSKF